MDPNLPLDLIMVNDFLVILPLSTLDSQTAWTTGIPDNIPAPFYADNGTSRGH